MSDNHPQATLAQCPRCGYDQRGAIVMWTESCPLHFTCTECGLLIDTPELMNPLLLRPRWCIEYGSGRLELMRRSMMTLLIVHWPWALWRKLRMIDPPRLGRLVMALVVMMLLCATIVHITFCSVEAIYTYSTLLPWMPAPTVWTVITSWFINPMNGDYVGPLQEAMPVAANLRWMAIVLFLSPLGFMALPVSRRRAKVRLVHVARVMLYSFMLVFLVPIVLVAGKLFDTARSLFWVVDDISGLLFWCSPVLAAIFWQAATRRYLRMDHSWGVAIATALISWLTLFLAIAIFQPFMVLRLVGGSESQWWF